MSTRVDDYRERLAAFFQTRPAVLFALVFGSVARGEARPDSDLDIAVMLDIPECDKPAAPALVRSTLTADLMSACRRNDIDVAILNSATPLLQHRVLRDGDVVYCRDLSALSQFTVRAMQRYVDTKPLRELQRERLARLLEPAPHGGTER